MRRPRLWLATATHRIVKIVRSTPVLTGLIAVIFTSSGLLTVFLQASGDQVFPQRSLRLLNSAVSATTSYTLSFTIATPTTLGSINAQFCSNDPLVTDPCDVPAGLDLSGATLTTQTGETGFSINPSTTANDLILTRTPAASTAHPVSYKLSGVVNPSAEGSYYVRLQTFASTDGTGAETDHGGIAFAINSNVSITSVVPPYLLFCTGLTITNFDCNSATGDYINFGDFSTTAASSAQTQMVAATNGAGGYTISYNGSTLTSGNNVIPALATADVSRPGVSQFGINLAANQDPSGGANKSGPGNGSVVSAYAQPNLYKFVSDDVIATCTTTADFNKYTVSYIANIAKDQSPGIYASTLTYVTVANF